jgi:hypothetical protein
MSKRLQWLADEEWARIEPLPTGVRPLHHGLQSLQPLESSGSVAADVRGPVGGSAVAGPRNEHNDAVIKRGCVFRKFPVDGLKGAPYKPGSRRRRRRRDRLSY